METSAELQSPIVTQIVKAEIFYPAEDYHRELYGKNSEQYVFYRNDCGRDGYDPDHGGCSPRCSARPCWL